VTLRYPLYHLDGRGSTTFGRPYTASFYLFAANTVVAKSNARIAVAVLIIL
jgi:hypothetical protein